MLTIIFATGDVNEWMVTNLQGVTLFPNNWKLQFGLVVD